MAKYSNIPPHTINYIWFELYYRAKYTCWLQAPSFHWGFLLPAGCLLLFNLVVFAVLTKKIVIGKRENLRSTAKDRPLVDRFVNAVTLTTMMGLTWIFGYFLLIPFNVQYEGAMQWLFTIFNVFQGFVVFYLYCLRRESIRRIWWNRKKSAKLMSSNSNHLKRNKMDGSSSQETKKTSITSSNV